MAATITATTGGGNWSTTSTWVGGVLPDPLTDTVIIPSTLTAPVVLDDSRTIPTTTIEDEVYGLVQGSGVTTTLGGPLTVGNGTSKDGLFVFGAGATLAQGANNVILGNCSISSNATSVNWATVTGSGAWTTHATVTGPKQRFVPQFVSFQNTGVFLVALKNTTGAIAQELNIQHCVFNGQSSVTFGTSSGSDLNFTRNINYSDFVDVASVVVVSSVGTPTPLPDLRYNTFRKSGTVGNLRVSIAGEDVTDNIFDGVQYGVAYGAVVQQAISRNFFTLGTTQGTAGKELFRVREDFQATASDNYLFGDYPNPHFITKTGTAAGSATILSDNVAEAIYNFNQADFSSVGTKDLLVRGNLLIGEMSQCYAASSTGAGTTSCYNNTIYKTSQNDALYGSLFYNEIAGPFSGTLNLTNNLVILKSTLTPTASDKLVHIFGGFPQVVNKLGWNAYYNITDPYDTTYTVTTNQTATDITTDPGLVDSSRNLAKWGQVIHGTDGTVAAAKAKLLAVNGYNTTTKKQSDAPSGAVVYGTSTALVDWVRAGFVPTNIVYKTAGEGGTYIGAMDVPGDVTPLVFPAALMMVQ